MATCQKLVPEKTTRRGRPRANLREVVNAILYVQKTGCQWRMLPHDFPHWRTVYGWFVRWRDDGTWLKIHDQLVQNVRQKSGKKPKPSVGIIDSQTVKTASIPGVRGYDGGKKTVGRKRFIVVDTLGMIQALAVLPANESEESGAALVLHQLREKVKKLKLAFADSAYVRRQLPQWIQTTLGITIEIVRRMSSRFEVQPKRWIVERTFGWMNHDRRLSKDFERLPETAEAMIQIGMIRRMLNRLE